MTEEHHRFSDEELQKFYAEFVDHIEAEKAVQNTLTEAVNRNTLLVTESTRSTKELLEAWNAAQGALKVVAVLGRAVKWMAGIVGAVGVIWYTMRHGGPTK